MMYKSTCWTCREAGNRPPGHQVQERPGEEERRRRHRRPGPGREARLQRRHRPHPRQPPRRHQEVGGAVH